MQDDSASPENRPANRRRRATWRLLLVVGLASLALLANQIRSDQSMLTPNPGGTQSARESVDPTPVVNEPPPIDGPTVWYSVLGNGRLTLYERRLDGRAEPIELAFRPSNREGQSEFMVDPDGRTILFAQRASGRTTIEPIARAAPQAPPAWRVDIPSADFRNGLWSPDGRYWAGYSNRGRATHVIVVDATAGRVSTFPLQEDESVQGFTGTGAELAMRTGRPSANTGGAAFRFATIDPSSGVRQDTTLEELDLLPQSTDHTEVAPYAGIWLAEDYGRRQIVVGDLRTGARYDVGSPGLSFWWTAFSHDASEVFTVAAAGDDACGGRRYVMQAADLDGGTRVLWDGAAAPLDFTFAVTGDYVGFDAWIEYVGSAMVVVDTISGRSTVLPTPPGSYLGSVLAIHGGSRLPDPAVPQVPASPPPELPAGELLAGAPQLATGAVEYDAVTCQATIRVRLLAPTVDGGLAIVDELEPAVFRDVERTDAWVDLAPRPHSNQILVGYGGKDAFEQFLWTPDPGRRPGSTPKIEALPLPADWPEHLAPGSWRGDGKAIGLGSTRRGNYLWFELGDETTHRVRIREQWQQVIGWSSDGDEILIMRNGCIDFCDVVETWAARVRLSDGRVRDVTQRAPADALASSTLRGVSVHSGLAAYQDVRDGRRIDFSQGLGVPGDFSFQWPKRAGRLAGDSREVWSQDGRSLYVVAKMGDGRALFRIDDPREGVALRPKLLGRLPAGAELDQVEFGGTWAEVGISALGTCREGLVDLSTGQAYLLDACAMSEVWVPEP